MVRPRYRFRTQVAVHVDMRVSVNFTVDSERARPGSLYRCNLGAGEGHFFFFGIMYVVWINFRRVHVSSGLGRLLSCDSCLHSSSQNMEISLMRIAGMCASHRVNHRLQMLFDASRARHTSENRHGGWRLQPSRVYRARCAQRLSFFACDECDREKTRFRCLSRSISNQKGSLLLSERGYKYIVCRRRRRISASLNRYILGPLHSSGWSRSRRRRALAAARSPAGGPSRPSRFGSRSPRPTSVSRHAVWRAAHAASQARSQKLQSG